MLIDYFDDPCVVLIKSKLIVRTLQEQTRIIIGSQFFDLSADDAAEIYV